MKKRLLLAMILILAMGITACSTGAKESAAGAGAESGTSGGTGKGSILGGTKDDLAEAGSASESNKTGFEAAPDNPGESLSESLQEDGIPQGDPIIGIVDSFENNIIVIRDMDDEDIVLHFSTRDAQVIEGDSPIAPGDVVEITYRGVQGDAEHPGTAVKVVAESMMYSTERDDS